MDRNLNREWLLKEMRLFSSLLGCRGFKDCFWHKVFAIFKSEIFSGVGAVDWQMGAYTCDYQSGDIWGEDFTGLARCGLWNGAVISKNEVVKLNFCFGNGKRYWSSPRVDLSCFDRTFKP